MTAPAPDREAAASPHSAAREAAAREWNEAAARLGRERVRRAQLGLELLHDTAPTLTTSARGAADLGIPDTESAVPAGFED